MTIFTKRRIKIGSVVLVILVIGYFIFAPKGQETQYTTEKATKGTVEQIVSVTGTVSADQKIDLRFQKPGKVASIAVKAGDTAQAGDTLASLDSVALDIAIAQAEASLDSARSALELKLAGATEQEIKLAETDVESARVAYEAAVTSADNTEKSAAQTLQKAELAVGSAQVAYDNASSSSTVTATGNEQAVTDAYVNAKSSVTLSLITARNSINKLDEVLGINNDDLSEDFKDFLGGKNYATRGIAETAFIGSDAELKKTEAAFASFSATWPQDQVDAFLPAAIAALRNVRDANRKTFVLLDNSNPAGVVLTQTLIDSFKTSISTNESALETNISTLEKSAQAITNAKLGKNTSGLSSSTAVDNARTALDTAKRSLEQTRVENAKLITTARADVDIKKAAHERAKVALEVKRATPRPVDTAGLRAQVAAAQAAYDLATQNASDARIDSPIDGVVTDVTVDVGENASGNETAITVVTEAQIVKANVSETDIGKVKIGQGVTMTLDAFAKDQVFTGTIAEIDPAETVVQGVIYYEITLVFDETNATNAEGVKPGMTANIEIVAARKEDVLSISPQALQYKSSSSGNNKPYVRLPGSNGTTIDRSVTLGIQGNTTVEITEGLEEGEEVVLFERK